MMTAVVYLDGEVSSIHPTFVLVHLLEHMVIELFGRNEQPPEEITCLAVLGGQKSVYRIKFKRLVEKAPL
jgi:hypothetical protein